MWNSRTWLRRAVITCWRLSITSWKFRGLSRTLCAEASAEFARTSRDYKAQTITVHVGEGARRVLADKRVIKQTLANLLSNAVKFTSAQGKIAIRAWVEGSAFCFEVRDDGQGIEPALMPHLTDLFRHADHGFSRKHEGMGAGLYLVKRYIELMKGSLAFESALGKGTRVKVTLPGAAVAARAVAPVDADAA
jgi:signal transduction histidine kinase